MATYTDTKDDGSIVEYRRHPLDPTIILMESRVLKPDGTPHDDRWFPVSDWELLNLQRAGTGIVEALSKEENPVEAPS